MSRVPYTTICLAICLAPLALAQTDTFTITDSNPNGFTMGGVYVSPYLGTVQSGNQTIFSGMVICDDFMDEVTVPESWTASASTVDSGGTGLFGSTSSTAYNEVAWLADTLLNNGNYNNRVAASELSFAIWEIFDPGASAYVTSVGSLTQSQVQSAVSGDITAAGKKGNYTGPTVTVWTPTSWKGDPSRPQEFLTIQTPEAPTLANLGVDLGALLAVIFVLRRRIMRGRLGPSAEKA